MASQVVIMHDVSARLDVKSVRHCLISPHLPRHTLDTVGT